MKAKPHTLREYILHHVPLTDVPLISKLAENKNKSVSYSHLARFIYGNDYTDNDIHTLRCKISKYKIELADLGYGIYHVPYPGTNRRGYGVQLFYATSANRLLYTVTNDMQRRSGLSGCRFALLTGNGLRKRFTIRRKYRPMLKAQLKRKLIHLPFKGSRI